MRTTIYVMQETRRLCIRPSSTELSFVSIAMALLLRIMAFIEVIRLVCPSPLYTQSILSVRINGGHVAEKRYYLGLYDAHCLLNGRELKPLCGKSVRCTMLTVLHRQWSIMAIVPGSQRRRTQCTLARHPDRHIVVLDFDVVRFFQSAQLHDQCVAHQTDDAYTSRRCGPRNHKSAI